MIDSEVFAVDCQQMDVKKNDALEFVNGILTTCPSRIAHKLLRPSAHFSAESFPSFRCSLLLHLQVKDLTHSNTAANAL